MSAPDATENTADRLRQLLLQIYVSGAIRDDLPDEEYDRLLTTILDAAENRPFAELGLPFPRPAAAAAARDDEMARVVPATPGCFVIYPLAPDNKTVLKSPIVAWAIDSDGFNVLPITPNGLRDGAVRCRFILMPDGSVTDPQVYTWPSIEAFLADPDVFGDRA